MKKTTLLTTMLLLCALMAGGSSAWAESHYTITFKDTGSTGDGNTARTSISDIISDGADYVYALPTATKVYNGRKGRGIKLGSKNDDGELVMKLKETIKPTKIVVNAIRYSESENQLAMNGTNFTLSSTATDYQIDYGGATDVSSISLKGSPRAYVVSVSVYYDDGPTNPTAVTNMEEFIETATIDTDGSAISEGTHIDCSGNVNTTDLGKYSNGLKLEKSKGVITISLPTGATNASVTLLSSSQPTSLKLGGSDSATPVSFSSDDSNGYTAKIDIPDSFAGKDFTIKKGDGSPIIYLITLTYSLESDTEIFLSTTDNMDGWRTFYDNTQDYTVDENTKIYVVCAKSGVADQVELTPLAEKNVKAGTPVILKTTAANHKMTLTKTTGAADLGENLLEVTTGSAVDGFRLGYGSTNGVGFYPYVSDTPAAGIVYIDKANVNVSGGAHGLTISFADDETTNIEIVSSEDKASKARKIMKDGRIIVESTKGMFLLNGAQVK